MLLEVGWLVLTVLLSLSWTLQPEQLRMKKKVKGELKTKMKGEMKKMKVIEEDG